MVLICISLMVSEVEHSFMCLLTIHMSSSGKCLIGYLDHFVNGVFFFDVESYEFFGYLGC